MINLTVFVSGRGSNLKALYNFFDKKSNAPKIKFVVSDNPDCQAIDFAKSKKTDVFFISKKATSGKVSWSEAIRLLKKENIDLVILAGFLKKLPDEFVKAFENKIINIHPALLPSFGGKGMYGINVHKTVYESSAKVSGATVHFVNENYDEGKIIAQRCVDISDVKSPEEIADRVLKIEHELLPYVVSKFAEGKIKIENSRVIIE
jgi:formyltetrahydrofolate-dependent phosphoribosylglycinamide formyltransferase